MMHAARMIVTSVAKEMTRGRTDTGLVKLLSVGWSAVVSILVVTARGGLAVVTDIAVLCYSS